MDGYDEYQLDIIRMAILITGEHDEDFIEELLALDKLIQNAGGRLRSRQEIASCYMDYRYRRDTAPFKGSPKREFGAGYADLSR